MTKPSAQRVLVVEDDDELRERILVPGLRACGFDARGVGSAREMYRSLLLHPADVVVLDVGLPDEDGFTAARHLREGPPLGIVMLTGRRARKDRVRGLDDGADAYLSKPVDLDVLAATLRSVLRRTLVDEAPDTAPAPPAPLDWGLSAEGWHLITPGGARILLGQSERLFLECLMQDRGSVVSREALSRHLTVGAEEFDPHRIEMLIHRLRRKVFAVHGERLPVETVRGMGYVMMPA